MYKKSEEKVGTILVLIAIFVFGLIPILSKYAVGLIHPLFLGAILALVGFLIPIPILIKKKEFTELIRRENIIYLLMIAFFGTVFTSILFLYGAQMTSGINASLLLQTEPIFATILGFFILKENVTKKQIFAMLLIIIGVSIITYNGALSLNFGDILVMLTPFGFQVGHVVVKKVVKKIETYVIVAGRFLYAGLILLALSTLLDTNDFKILLQPFFLTLILFLGFLEVVGYILWIEALKRINLSKASVLITPYPLISVVFAWPILSELPTVFQIIGLIAVIVGMYTMGRIKSRIRK